MIVTVKAHKIAAFPSDITVDIDLSEFDPAMDAEAVAEHLSIAICQDGNCIDIDEQDLYQEAERVYQELRNG